MSADDDLRAALTALLSRWSAAAAEAQQKAGDRRLGDIQQAYFQHGVYKTYLAAIADLGALIGTDTPPPPAAHHYALIPLEQARALLERAGLYPRDLLAHRDGAFTAQFSRLQPVTQAQRVERLSAADPRVVVLDVGFLADNGEPFIDFALRADDV